MIWLMIVLMILLSLKKCYVSGRCGINDNFLDRIGFLKIFFELILVADVAQNQEFSLLYKSKAMIDPAELVLAYSSKITGAMEGSNSRPSMVFKMYSFMLAFAWCNQKRAT